MQRVKSLDLARGFTVLMMAPVHTILLYSKPYVYDTLPGKLLAFIAEGPGAQLFMLIMGICFTFSKHTIQSVLQRAFILLLAAYALNIFKFILPSFLYPMPIELLKELQVNNDFEGRMQMFLLGDILHFAALTLLILFFVSRLQHYYHYALYVAIFICFTSPFFWDAYCTNPAINYILQLTGGQPPRVYFPLLPWLVYPLVGLSIGYFFQTETKEIFLKLGIIGCLLVAGGYVLQHYFLNDPASSFYRTYPADTIQHIGIVLITLDLWELVERYVKPNYFFKLLSYSSLHITQIYCIQWILIFWLLPLFGYQQLDLIPSLFCIILTTIITYFLSFCLNVYGKRKPV